MIGNSNEVIVNQQAEAERADLLKSYDMLTFVNDLTDALFMDEHLKNRVTTWYVKDNGIDFYDSFLDCRIDFVTNWILLSQNRCTASFMTLFAKNKRLTKDTVALSDIYDTKTRSSTHKSDYDAIATMMAIVQNNTFMIEQYGQSFCEMLGI
jgi:hypothetical protein